MGPDLDKTDRCRLQPAMDLRFLASSLLHCIVSHSDDGVAGEDVGHGNEVISSPSDHLESEGMCLPQPKPTRCRVLEAVADGEQVSGGAGAQVMGVEDPIIARRTTPAQRNRKCRRVTGIEIALYSIHNKTSSLIQLKREYSQLYIALALC